MPKTIIVTGASKGIGLAVAQYLIEASNNVVVLARSGAALQELKAKHPTQVQAVAADLSDPAVAQSTVEATLEEFGQIDALVLNHGTLEPVTRISDSSVEAWKKGFDVNFFSAVAWVTAALPALRKSHGRIIFTSSGAAINAYTGWGAYGASKAALNHLALTLGAEEPDVTSISVRPGVVDTDMQRDIREVHGPGMLEKDVARYHKLHKEGGLLKPEQPGHVIAKLAVDGPRDLTGRFLSWNDKDLSSFQE
ncbi:sterol 24-C-methyltransferase [Physcia stellaris]|nr:sterol 24-C-methyltransferase [Physcia stellaris]